MSAATRIGAGAWTSFGDENDPSTRLRACAISIAVGREVGLGERRPTRFEDPADAESGSTEVAAGVPSLTIPGNARSFAENMDGERDHGEPRDVEDGGLTPLGALPPYVPDGFAIVSPLEVGDGFRGGGAVGGGDNTGIGGLAGRAERVSTAFFESNTAFGRNWGGGESLEGRDSV